jgi:hypothetical protein
MPEMAMHHYQSNHAVHYLVAHVDTTLLAQDSKRPFFLWPCG